MACKGHVQDANKATNNNGGNTVAIEEDYFSTPYGFFKAHTEKRTYFNPRTMDSVQVMNSLSTEFGCIGNIYMEGMPHFDVQHGLKGLTRIVRCMPVNFNDPADSQNFAKYVEKNGTPEERERASIIGAKTQEYCEKYNKTSTIFNGAYYPTNCMRDWDSFIKEHSQEDIDDVLTGLGCFMGDNTIGRSLDVDNDLWVLDESVGYSTKQIAAILDACESEGGEVFLTKDSVTRINDLIKDRMMDVRLGIVRNSK